jgi:hypothetical protein
MEPGAVLILTSIICLSRTDVQTPTIAEDDSDQRLLRVTFHLGSRPEVFPKPVGGRGLGFRPRIGQISNQIAKPLHC